MKRTLEIVLVCLVLFATDLTPGWATIPDEVPDSETLSALFANLGQGCSNPMSSATVCLDEKLCVRDIDGSYFRPTNGACSAGSTLVTVQNVTGTACAAAADLVYMSQLKCADCCNDLGEPSPSQSTTASCCTITRTKNCAPKNPTPPECEVVVDP